jgi:hypothetical protein
MLRAQQGVRAMPARLPFRSRFARIWRCIAPRQARGVLAVCLVFGALIVAGFYAVKDPAALFRSASIAGNGSTAGKGDVADAQNNAVTGARDLDANDPVVRFSATRVGHVLYASRHGDNCRRVLFDNRTGHYHDAHPVFCGPVLEQPSEAGSNDRMLALRKSFQK